MDICKARCEGNSDCVAYDMAASSSVCTIYRTNTGTTTTRDYTAVQCSGRSKLRYALFSAVWSVLSNWRFLIKIFICKFTIEITENPFTSNASPPCVFILDKHRIGQTFFRHYYWKSEYSAKTEITITSVRKINLDSNEAHFMENFTVSNLLHLLVMYFSYNDDDRHRGCARDVSLGWWDHLPEEASSPRNLHYADLPGGSERS